MNRSLMLVALIAVATTLSLASTASAATPQVAIADTSTCFLTDAGSVSCQGNNEYGQLAQPNTILTATPPLPVSGLPAIQEIEAGDEFFCARDAAGQVYCWGQGTAGQMGNGGTSNSFSPAQVPGVSGALQLAALDDDICVLFAGGAVKCWGSNNGQFGMAWANGTHASPVDVGGFGGATQIADGDDVLCGVFADGSVKCQGANDNGQAGQPVVVPNVGSPQVVPGVTGAVSVTAGEDFTCALVSDGSARCWGSGSNGQLGQGADLSDKFVPVQVQGLSGAVKLIAGEEHVCALRSDGAVLCWGESSSGQSGQDADFVGTASVVAGLGAAIDVFVGYDGGCALLAGGGVSCWGDNPDGGFGAPAGGDVVTPRLMQGVDLVTLPQSASSATLTFTGKAKVDRKKKNYTRSATLTITPSKYVVLAEACAGTATATTSYRYTVVRKRRGKRVKVKRTKKITSRANLAVSGATCVANFSLKRLPVKYLNKKTITVTASAPANAAAAAVSISAKTKLPKVTIKKKRR